PSFLNLQPQGGVYPTNIAVGGGANPLQTVALFQNREDVWRLITGTSASVDVYSSKDGTSQVRMLGNIGADSFTQKNDLLSPNGLTFEPADKLPGTSIDASATNLNFNTGAGAVWTYKPQRGGYRNALSAGLTYETTDLNAVNVTGRALTAGQPNISS